MINEIKIPQVLVDQKDFCLKIDQNNTKLYAYIENLKKFVKDTHEIYQQLCRKMNKTSQELERKIINHKYTTKHRVSILNFIKNINVLHVSICNQLNKNSINFNTKNNKGPQNRLQILKKKLQICNRLNQEYLQMVKTFNQKQKSLRQKCEYFNDYEKAVIKYYSLKANTQFYEQLSAQELKVKQRLQIIIRSKDQYKINVSQIRVSLQDFYNTELNTISQYKKLLLNIRKVGSGQIYNQIIIEEQTEESRSSILENEAPLTKRSQRLKDHSVVEMRKQIIKEYQSCFQIQQYFQEFMNTYKQEIELIAQQIDVIRSQNEYQKITSQRLIMAQIISTQVLREIDQIINEISILREIVSKLINIFGVTRVLVQLKKYRGFNFDKFIQDTNNYAQEQRRNGVSIDSVLGYKRFEQKFYQKHNEFNIRYQQRVTRLQKDIYEQYYYEGNTLDDKSKRNIKNSLFQKKYYQILVIPFFLNKMENYNYIDNKYLKRFSNHLNANKMQKMVTLTGFFGKGPHVRMKSTCCGLIKKEESEGPVLIDDFNCALKDGLMLIQGKLKLYQNYLKFYSTFNSRTILFGSTDLRIPKWDIINFGKQSHLISLMVNVQTSHGTLSFTSFLTNPLQKLLRTYNNRKSGMSITPHKNIGISQLQILQTRFQSQFRNSLKRKDIIMDKLSTYLSQDTQSLSVSIEYHHASIIGDTVLFEIKINYSEITMQYMFIHDESQKNHQIKETLEQVSKDLINKKGNNSAKNKNQKSFSLDFEESIIIPNQINKVSFLKEPSFIKRKQNSVNEQSFRNSQVQLGQLLGSKNSLFNPQTSKNIEMLQQKIFLSDQNLSKSTDQKQSPVSRQSLQQFQKSTSNKTASLSPKQQSSTSNQIKCKSKFNTTKSRKSSQTAKSSNQPFNYKTVFLFLAILLGLNLMLSFFN